MRKSSPSKGWAKRSPKRGKQREHMLRTCGPDCFLRPKDKGFPICESNCEFSCPALAAAISRAGQYKYTSIQNKARKIAQNEGCSQR